MKYSRSFNLSLFAAVALCISLPYAQAVNPTAAESFGIRIAQIPPAVANDQFASSYIISRIKPGAPLSQRLEVVNNSTQTLKVHVYPGLATYDGEQFLVGDGAAGNKLSSWTALTPNFLTLKPGETNFFIMTISPPGDAPSTQEFGVIWAEVQGTTNATGITSVSRVGIRMYIPIGDAPDIIISQPKITSPNELIGNNSLLSAFRIKIVTFFVFISILFFILFFFFRHRSKSNRKYRRENERQLEGQWKRERDRRREIWKRGGHVSTGKTQKPSYDEFDEDDEENR